MPEIGNGGNGVSPAAADDDGSFFGKYELGKLVGVGAFGKVYHARNIATGQSVAIKAVSKKKIAKGGLAAHVKREIAIMRRLRNPNVVKLHEVLATKTKIYFVMEFAKGGELFAKIEHGRFGEDLSRRFFQQLISAVGYCHSRGVFHRDLKPENLLLDENWDLKVSDFGLSAVNDQIRPDGLLHTLCGTPAYVAPEILEKKGYDGAKADVWSCGVILFVLNAGYLPFNDANLMAMYRKIHRGDFRCPKWTSPELRRLLSRLLDTNPETRITVDEILHDVWFEIGFVHRSFHVDELDSKADESAEQMNAFDLISCSSGFDLSGLISGTDTSVFSDRFISAKTPEKILEKVDAVARAEGVTVAERTKLGAKMEGHNGNFMVAVEIHRLTEKLVMVEIRKKNRNGNGPCNEMWVATLKLELKSLVHRPEVSVPDH